jgi:chromosome partitioning protein
MAEARILSVVNQKGGVGKTTLCYHLCHRAAELGLKTAVFDLDSQANLTFALTGNVELLKTPGGAAQIFDLAAPIEPRPIADLLPEPRPFAPLDVYLLHGHNRLDAVDAAFRTATFLDERVPDLRRLPFDLLLIDTPPSVGSRQLAAVLAADLVVIPLTATDFGTTGLARTRELIRDAREAIRLRHPAADRPRPWTLINMFRSNVRSQRQRAAELLAIPELNVRHPFLTLRASVEDSLAAALPVWRYRKASSPVRALWKDCATETLRQLIPAEAAAP